MGRFTCGWGYRKSLKDGLFRSMLRGANCFSGNGSVLAGVGPLLGGMLTALQQLEEDVRPEVWLVTELPITDVPDGIYG